jgi:hypothetical protein
MVNRKLINELNLLRSNVFISTNFIKDGQVVMMVAFKSRVLPGKPMIIPYFIAVSFSL